MRGPSEQELIEMEADRYERLNYALQQWEDAYPVEVFPELVEGELQHAMALVNAEDRNQSARLYASWARHIVRCIREKAAEDA